MGRYTWLLLEGPGLSMQIIKSLTELDEIRKIPHGDMVPTVFIPGFGASNASTYIMRRLLNEKHHNTIKWVEHKNNGFNPIAIQNTLSQIKHLADSHGTPVNIVGQSLGGCYARTIGNEIPDYVNVIVTLGSPIKGIDKIDPRSVDKYNTLVGLADAAFLHHSEYFHSFSVNPSVPTTSLYSKSDGVVHWSLSAIDESPLSENIEINGNHFGMGFDISNISVIGDRIKQSKENWNKFYG
jgi:pimeloyl-ACP methyl ester carboxylesterase